ncbi:hypothetical protein ES708_24513 [subsurface metagenome]
MKKTKALQTLRHQLSKPPSKVGPGLKEAIKLSIKAIETAGPALFRGEQ